MASAFLYLAAKGTWSGTGSLADGRWLHTATLLPNKKVLVVGGQGNISLLQSAELYHPAGGYPPPVFLLLLEEDSSPM